MNASTLQARDVQAVTLVRELLASSLFRPSYALATVLALSNTLARLLADERYQRACEEVAGALDAAERVTGPTYSVDGAEPCSLASFLDAHAATPLPLPVLACLIGLAPGEDFSLDFGAGSVVPVRRVT